MKFQTIPRTGLNASRICFGVMRFNMVTRGEADFELYRQFREAGGNLFDTAAWAPAKHASGRACAASATGQT